MFMHALRDSVRGGLCALVLVLGLAACSSTPDTSTGAAQPAIAADGGLIGTRATQAVVVVTHEAVNLRGGPGMDYQVIDYTTEGTRLEVVDDERGWLEVKRSDDRTAWIAGRLTRKLGQDDATITVSAEGDEAAPVPGPDPVEVGVKPGDDTSSDLLPSFDEAEVSSSRDDGRTSGGTDDLIPGF